MKNKQEDYGLKLQESYDNWAHVYEHGCSDPFWEDGVNLGLIKSHVIYYRNKIEETMPPENYPAAYFKELPPEVDQRYMARPDEIRAAANAARARYMTDPNYQYILRHYNDFTPKTRDRLCLDSVIGYAMGLEKFIEQDRLVDMRRHEHCERYLESFEDCARSMQAAPPEAVQQSLFSIYSGAPAETNEDEDDDFDEGVNEQNNNNFGGKMKYKIKGQLYDPVPMGGDGDWYENSDDDKTCGDCGVPMGEYHLANCDIERCPVCGGQFFSCEHGDNFTIVGDDGQPLSAEEELSREAYQAYIHEYYAGHDRDNAPVCYDEFYNNEWQDTEIKARYMKKLGKTAKRGSEM